MTSPVARAWALGRAWLGAALELVLASIAPPTCAACAARVPPRRVFCGTCRESLEPLPPPVTPGKPRAAFAYGGAVAVAIRAFKYGRRADLARPLGHLLRGFLRAHPCAVDVVVPVPLHPRRLAERGHDQTALLARHVADELGVACDATVLDRVLHGPAQASLSRQEREQGASLVFLARRSLASRRVLLVDDVVTTGSTARACERALRDAGAASVQVLAVARTLAIDDDGSPGPGSAPQPRGRT